MNLRNLSDKELVSFADSQAMSPLELELLARLRRVVDLGRAVNGRREDPGPFGYCQTCDD